MMLSDPGQVIVALGFCATVAITVTSIARVLTRRIDAGKQSRLGIGPDVQERMSRIEQAVDAIAIEVERMSEGQRFTTRLLAERLGERPPGVDARAAGQPLARSPGSGDINGPGGRHER